MFESRLAYEALRAGEFSPARGNCLRPKAASSAAILSPACSDVISLRPVHVEQAELIQPPELKATSEADRGRERALAGHA